MITLVSPRAAVLRWCVVAVVAGAAHAPSADAQERRLTVEVAKTRCLSIKRAVERHTISTDPPAVARSRFSDNRLCVEGLQPGTATVKFSGTYRRIVVGKELREEGRPFTETFEVRVTPPPADVRTVPTRFEVELGKTRRMQLSVVMTPTFTRHSEKDDKWRALGVAAERPGLVAVRVFDDRDRMFFEFRGLQLGRTQIRFKGQRRLHGTWQDVVRIVTVEVQQPER